MVVRHPRVMHIAACTCSRCRGKAIGSGANVDVGKIDHLAGTSFAGLNHEGHEGTKKGTETSSK
jgi:hypothetical protein